MAHQFLCDLDALFLLDKQSCEGMPERMPAHLLGDPRPDCRWAKLSL
jgi:hypothetical protein